MKKSLLVTALALVLALGVLVGLGVKLGSAAAPLGTKAVSSWGDPSAAEGLTVHTTSIFGGKLLWDTDYRVTEGEEDTRFVFKPQGQVQKLGALITDVKDEWFLTQMCLTESGSFATEDLFSPGGQTVRQRTVDVKEAFVSYGLYLTDSRSALWESNPQELADRRIPFDKIRLPIGEEDQLLEAVHYHGEKDFVLVYEFIRLETRTTPFSVGKNGHTLVTLGFAADAPVQRDWAPEGFGIWEIPVTETNVDTSASSYYVARRPDVSRARLVYPLDIESQRVVAMDETDRGDVLLVTAESGRFVLRVLDGETCELRGEFDLGPAETVTWTEHEREITDYRSVTIRPGEGFTLLAVNDELLVLEDGANDYRISLRSPVTELRFSWNGREMRDCVWRTAGTPDEDGEVYAGDYYGPNGNALGYYGYTMTYRDGTLALAYCPSAYAETDVFLEVYGDGSMLYGALIRNGLSRQVYSQNNTLSIPWSDPLELIWGEE